MGKRKRKLKFGEEEIDRLVRYIYIHAFSRHFYPKRFQRESFPKVHGSMIINNDYSPKNIVGNQNHEEYKHGKHPHPRKHFWAYVFTLLGSLLPLNNVNLYTQENALLV